MEGRSSVTFAPGSVLFPGAKGVFAGYVKIGKGSITALSMGIPVSYT